MNFIRNWLVSTFICNGNHQFICFTFERVGKTIHWEHKAYPNMNQHRCQRCDTLCPFGEAEETTNKNIDAMVALKLPGIAIANKTEIDYNTNA